LCIEKKNNFLAQFDLSELNRENQKLKQENAVLREKISQLEGHEANNKSLIGSLPKKNTALFAILLVVSFNVFAFG
jgi:cell shape-determining protein MreC